MSDTTDAIIASFLAKMIASKTGKYLGSRLFQQRDKSKHCVKIFQSNSKNSLSTETSTFCSTLCNIVPRMEHLEFDTLSFDGHVSFVAHDNPAYDWNISFARRFELPLERLRTDCRRSTTRIISSTEPFNELVPLLTRNDSTASQLSPEMGEIDGAASRLSPQKTVDCWLLCSDLLSFRRKRKCALSNFGEDERGWALFRSLVVRQTGRRETACAASPETGAACGLLWSPFAQKPSKRNAEP